MTTLFTAAASLQSAWATAVELAPLLLVPAAVWAIRIALEAADALARAAQLTYRAGRAAGRFWYAHGLPALLAAADGISWLIAQIDWQQVAGIVRQGLVLLTAAVITAAITARQLLIAGSAALGRWYAARLLPAAVTPAAVTPAAVSPAAVSRTAQRRRTHCPSLARWAASESAELPLWWAV